MKVQGPTDVLGFKKSFLGKKQSIEGISKAEIMFLCWNNLKKWLQWVAHKIIMFNLIVRSYN